jgi:hypothetical protein
VLVCARLCGGLGAGEEEVARGQDI